MTSFGVMWPNFSELLISSSITRSYSPEVRTSRAFAMAVLVSSRSLSRGTFSSMWSAPIGRISNPSILEAEMCSPYPPSGFRNWIMMTFSPHPTALKASPRAHVVLPLPFPV